VSLFKTFRNRKSDGTSETDVVRKLPPVVKRELNAKKEREYLILAPTRVGAKAKCRATLKTEA